MSTENYHNARNNNFNLPDGELWNLFLDGDKQAYAAIFQNYYPVLINYGLKIIRDKSFVEDGVQDLFIDLWNRKEGLAETDSIKYYLFKSVRRKLIHQLEKDRKQYQDTHQTGFDHFEMVLPYENELIHAQMADEKKQQLTAAMNKLTKRQKEAIYLRYYENMDSVEVAEVMALTSNSTYVLLSQALDALKKTMEKLGIFVLLSRVLGL